MVEEELAVVEVRELLLDLRVEPTNLLKRDCIDVLLMLDLSHMGKGGKGISSKDRKVHLRCQAGRQKQGRAGQGRRSAVRSWLG